MSEAKTTTTPAHIIEQAKGIADQAQAIADGKFNVLSETLTPLNAAVLRLLNNVETLAAWVKQATEAAQVEGSANE